MPFKQLAISPSQSRRTNGVKVCLYSCWHVVFAILFPFLPCVTVAQDTTKNLLFNGDFEHYTECPKRIESLGILMNVVGWWQPTTGSADYFNACSRQCGVPRNKLGYQSSRSGSGMIGIYASRTAYREYLQTELRYPLEFGERYRLTFYASLSEYSNAAIATLGGLFTPDRISSEVSEILIRRQISKHQHGATSINATFYEPQVVNALDNVLADTEGWMKISGEFVAQGGEKFLTIGNFYPEAQSNVIDPAGVTYKLTGAYYYIDDVSLVCLTCGVPRQYDNVLLSKAPESKAFEAGQRFVLENIFFDFNKSILLPQSFLELDNLLTIMKIHPTMQIELSGHTDSKGSHNYNQVLSEQRAAAVARYLEENGIAKDRVSSVGFGDSKPIATNKTDAGRAQNRRVEFKILSL